MSDDRDHQAHHDHQHHDGHTHSEEQGGDLLDRGLRFDLAYLRDRRAVLGLLGVGALGVGGGFALTRLGGAGDTVELTGATTSARSTSGGSSGTTTSGSSGSSAEIPSETAGPYPGDGSNGPDVLTESGVVRRDIRPSFGSASGVAEGVGMSLVLDLVGTSDGKPLKGLAVYVWHCTREGGYSMYSQGITEENYLRGVQVSDRRGRVRFTSVVPGCYAGRWPHVHFEVYASAADATGGGEPLVTSQVALPRKTAMHVYRGAEGYSASVQNLERVSLSSDMVFGDDGGVRQLADVSGSIASGYRVHLEVPVDV